MSQKRQRRPVQVPEAAKSVGGKGDTYLWAAGAECINEVEVVEEVDDCVTVKVSRGKSQAEGVNEVKVVEEVNSAIVVEFRRTGEGQAQLTLGEGSGGGTRDTDVHWNADSCAEVGNRAELCAAAGCGWQVVIARGDGAAC